MAKTVRTERCPFCVGNVIFVREDDGATYWHDGPPCPAWDRVCYEGQFTGAEVETYAAWQFSALDGAPRAVANG